MLHNITYYYYYYLFIAIWTIIKCTTRGGSETGDRNNLYKLNDLFTLSLLYSIRHFPLKVGKLVLLEYII